MRRRSKPLKLGTSLNKYSFCDRTRKLTLPCHLGPGYRRQPLRDTEHVSYSNPRHLHMWARPCPGSGRNQRLSSTLLVGTSPNLSDFKILAVANDERRVAALRR